MYTNRNGRSYKTGNGWRCLIIKNTAGRYSAEMYIDRKRVYHLPNDVNYKTLQEAIRDETAVCILNQNELIWKQHDGAQYAVIDADSKTRAYLDNAESINRQYGLDCRWSKEELTKMLNDNGKKLFNYKNSY